MYCFIVLLFIVYCYIGRHWSLELCTMVAHQGWTHGLGTRVTRVEHPGGGARSAGWRVTWVSAGHHEFVPGSMRNREYLLIKMGNGTNNTIIFNK